MAMKMRDLSLTSKAKKSFITDIHDLAPLEQGEHSSLEICFAKGKPDYIKNITPEEALENKNYFNGVRRKQAKDAVKHIDIYKERVAASKNIFIFAVLVASAFLVLSILGVSIEPVRNFIIGILNSNNAIAYVGLAVPLTSAAAFMALKESVKTQLDLSLIEKYKVFFDNEAKIEKYAEKPAVQRKLSAYQKTRLRKVVKTEGLNISNLEILSKRALESLVAEIDQLLISKQEGKNFEYRLDTIGIDGIAEDEENQDEEDQSQENPLVLGLKKKKRFQLFGRKR